MSSIVISVDGRRMLYPRALLPHDIGWYEERCGSDIVLEISARVPDHSIAVETK